MMNNSIIKGKIREALKLFVAKDKQVLLRVDIYEPTISHRIAVYLEDLFPGFDIDCEYNKTLLGDKKDVNGKKIRPNSIEDHGVVLVGVPLLRSFLNQNKVKARWIRRPYQ